MAFPVIRTVGTRAQSASAATLTPGLPAVDAAANGLLLCVVTSKNNATHSTVTAGWTKLTQVNSGASFTASIFVAAQGVAAPVITWAGAVACSAIIMYYSSPDGPIDLTIAASSSSAGTTTPHTSSAIVTTRANVLAVYIDAVATNTGLTAPSGWFSNFTSGSATDAGHTSFGSKTVPVAGTNTGATSSTGGAAAYVMFQLELRVTVGTDSIEVSKEDAAAWYEPRAGQSISKAEVGAWYEPREGLTTSKTDVYAWLDRIRDIAELSSLEVTAWLDFNGIFVSTLETSAWLDAQRSGRRMILIR